MPREAEQDKTTSRYFGPGRLLRPPRRAKQLKSCAQLWNVFIGSRQTGCAYRSRKIGLAMKRLCPECRSAVSENNPLFGLRMPAPRRAAEKRD